MRRLQKENATSPNANPDPSFIVRARRAGRRAVAEERDAAFPPETERRSSTLEGGVSSFRASSTGGAFRSSRPRKPTRPRGKKDHHNDDNDDDGDHNDNDDEENESEEMKGREEKRVLF